ncbi:WxL protein peptidoglycan domain-containing protein [Cellulomonas citrea]|uniref:WxL protein peptidoglycan domain-containing protein n=1 Tax=Cellulomonas citrea TaxID=1909423 RepID=UPI00135863B1|nr:DUF916 domain-containing protein [Cellulomonas citrea]
MHVSPTRPGALARLVGTAVATLLVMSGAGTALATSAAADEGDVAWSVRTVSSPLGSNRTSYSYNVDPGGHVDDAMVVTNHGTAPLDLAVYAADGFTADTGTLDLVTQGTTSTGIGAWVRTATATVTVQPDASVEVPFTLDVPAGATPGDYAGGVITSLTQPDAAAGITVDRRLGIKIALRVGGALTPGMAVQDVHLSYAGSTNPFASGDATLTYTIRNTGNSLLSAQQAATVTGPFGWWPTAAPPLDAAPQLLPGESWTVTVPVHGVLPSFRIAATATLVPVVTDASGSTSTLTPVAATAHTWAVPWTAVALLLLLVGAGVGAPVVLRRVRTRRHQREEARVREAVAQALQERDVTPVGAGAEPMQDGR